MIFREHRGGLEESMATSVVLPSRHALLLHIRNLLWKYNFYLTDEALHIKKYTKDGDARIGWKELYIVTVSHFGVIGWTNQACGDNEEPEDENNEGQDANNEEQQDSE